ncbi:unnamed protein product [Urochloa decumbens]|uniref:F-box domain-containing protein n=1 Tax=Urochloa decumbens TaxID=240449 RepID=A0ABC9FRH8_9POAL
MAEPGGRRRRVAWMAPGDGADYITALPLDLRARIASSLPFWQVAQLATLSRPWRHIHRHAPVVDLDLDDFLVDTDEILDEEDHPAVFLNEVALARLEVALARRGNDGSGSSMVDTLRIAFNAIDPRMRLHAELIAALAGARRTCVFIAGLSRSPPNAWSLDLSPAARVLDIAAEYQSAAPTVAGPGGAALGTLRLYNVVLHEWPRLPSLRSLTLGSATIQAPFPEGAWCPRLEDLCIFSSFMELPRVDIRLPLLKRLEMDEAYFSPGADVAVDAPELEELDVGCEAGYTAADYHSFTLRAPRLRCLTWSDQFAERVHIDVGKPGTVTSGRIEFTSSRAFDYCREMEDIRAQTMRMLQGLLPDLLPECVADAARPYVSLEKCTTENPYTGKPVPGEKLTCDLSGLFSSLKA